MANKELIDRVRKWGSNLSNGYANDLDALLKIVDGQEKEDVVNHPPHYTSHPSGIECIEITEHLNFNIGNAIKYLWRAGLKNPNPRKDLEKARWYVEREVLRLARTKDVRSKP